MEILRKDILKDFKAWHDSKINVGTRPYLPTLNTEWPLIIWSRGIPKNIRNL